MLDGSQVGMADAGTKRVELAEGALAYVERGPKDGALVVLQHGFPDYPGTFFPLMDRLVGAGYRCVAPYLRGYAPSTTAGPFDADRLGEDLVALSRELSPEGDVILVGHDWGAVATYAALRQAPELFRSGITLAVPHDIAFRKNVLSSLSQMKKSAYMAFFMLPRLPERGVPRDDFAFVDRLWRRWSPGYVAPPAHMQRVKEVLRASMPAPFEHYRALVPSPAGLRRLRRAAEARIDVPVLHLHGADDGCMAYDQGRGQERYFARAFESVEIEGVGHFLHLEDPDRVAEMILDFAERAERRSRSASSRR